VPTDAGLLAPVAGIPTVIGLRWSVASSVAYARERERVQDYLKSIFTKTSVRSRRALLSRALGT